MHDSEKRSEAWEKAVDNSRLSGITPTVEMEEIIERFFNYEIDEAETITLLFESLDTKKRRNWRFYFL